MNTVEQIELDEQTLEQLQPPCEFSLRSSYYPVPYLNAAEWIVRVRCMSCNEITILLLCQKDKGIFVVWPKFSANCSSEDNKAVTGQVVSMDKI